jgi:peptide/nickel transport system substrate-binding protein
LNARFVTLLAATTAVLGFSPATASYATTPAALDTGTIPLLRIGLSGSQATLDPMTNANAEVINGLGLETLMQFGPHDQLEPDLATSVTQPTPVSYVYHLRQGVKFWDGSPLTSADVVYSLNSERAPSSVSAWAYPAVKSIVPDGPYGVVVTLAKPDASWQYTMAEEVSEIFEMNFAEQHKGTFGNPGVLVMGTGPWEADNLDPTTGAQLSANPDWWGGKVPIQRISISFFSSDTSLALAMRAGEIDLDPQLLGGQRSFATTSGAAVVNTPGCGQGMFSMNTQVAPWNNVNVRRAVAYALNRSDLIAANAGYATPSYTFIPPPDLLAIATQQQLGSLVASMPTYRYNVAEAKAEMAESPYPHGFSATILEYDQGALVNVSQAVAGELQVLGIHLTIKVLPLAAWLANVAGPDLKRATTFYDAYCPSPDPGYYPDTYLGARNLRVNYVNTAAYNTPTINNLVNAGVATTNTGSRFAIYSKLMQDVATNVPYVPLFDIDYSAAVSEHFKIVGFNQFVFAGGDYALDVEPASSS